MTCGLCRDTGWVLDSRPSERPITLYLIPCPVPDCEESGREVEVLELHGDGKAGALILKGDLNGVWRSSGRA